ncbi:MAG: DUF4382 domain-containing protein, partial [Treponema sp.]|nr:DUF4382 domain-containing protein [Treponema sp.]
MTLIKNKKTLFLACAGLVFLAASALILTCKSPTSSSGSPENGSYPSETRLVVEIHDTPFKKDGINVEKILLTVIEMVIIDENGNHIVILDEERSMDILAVSQSEPVILSDVAVDPGTYEELRLVLHDDCTIQADGELHHIKIPSGEESGLKLKGPFNIPAGKLFRLTIDFAAEESVIYNHGEGFALKPVLNISN